MSVGSDAPAKIYSDQRTVTIHLGDSGDGFTLPFKEKWRAPDAAAAVIGFIAHRRGGHRQPGQRTCAAHPDLRRGADRRRRCGCCRKLPATRPSLPTRARWLWDNTRPRVSLLAPPAGERTRMSSLAPLRVVGNLRLTAAGVYADYLLSGQPFIFLSQEWQDRVAAEHAELWRTLPSGASISGLTVPVPARNIARKMLHAHPDLRSTPADGTRSAAAARPGCAHCRTWEPTVAAHRARRRIYWLTIPLDYGPGGATPTGGWRRLLDVAAGPRQGHRGVAGRTTVSWRREMVAALPRVFFPKPASVEQIWWHWNYTASRGVWPHPLPSQPLRPARQPARLGVHPGAFRPVRRGAARPALARPRAPTTRCSCAPTGNRTDGVADSYQALIPLDSFPDTGIAWPRSAIFKVLDDLTRPDTTLDWTIHTTFTTAETAVSTSQNVIVNIRDQYRQRGRHAASDDELLRKLASGKELASELKRGTAERGVNPSIVIAAAAADPDTVNARGGGADPQLTAARTSGRGAGAAAR